MMDTEKSFYTPRECAAILHTSSDVVRESLLNGATGWNFPYIMCGRRMKIIKSGFDAWLAGKGTNANEAADTDRKI